MLRGAGAAVEVSRVEQSRWERKERERCLPFFSLQMFAVHLSLACSILSRQRIHLLLQRSYCVFHWDRVGLHARVESSKSFHNSAASCVPHVTSRRHHQRVPHSFRQQPTSSTLPEIRQRAPLVQQTRNKQDTGFNSAPLPRLPCICSVSRAQGSGGR